jgi:ribosomal protein S18 acetylase RimI-like enzyme
MPSRALSAPDYDRWLVLWHQYLEFYKHELSVEQTTLTFERLINPDTGFHALVIEQGGQIVGFAHFSFTNSTWSANNDCYLEDLFVDPAFRGMGLGRELINSVKEIAKTQGSRRLYWFTHKDNQTAQRLYDSLAKQNDFLTYEIEL